MENFTKIEHEDGSIEYINNISIDPITLEHPVPEDIASLSLSQLEEKILENHIDLIRQERNKKLLECDWTQVADVSLTEEKKNEWILYRQSLRNLPSTIVDVSPINWPSKP
jgi:hypothetical protein